MSIVTQPAKTVTKRSDKKQGENEVITQPVAKAQINQETTTKEKKKRRSIDNTVFVNTWVTSKTVAEVAEKMEMSEASVLTKAHTLRNKYGVPLPEKERPAAQTGNIALEALMKAMNLSKEDVERLAAEQAKVAEERRIKREAAKAKKEAEEKQLASANK